MSFQAVTLFVAFFATNLWAHAGFEGLKNTIKRMTMESGLSFTEILAQYMAFMPNLICVIGFAFVFKSMTKGLSDFCASYADFGPDVAIVEEKALRSTAKGRFISLGLCYAIAVSASAAATAGFYPYLVRILTTH